jgi:hypothetical protein
VTQLGVEAPRTPERAPDSPADALAAVVDNAAALARAELRLAAAEARAWLVRIGLGVALLWLGLMLTQGFVLLLALSPVLWSAQTWPRVTVMLLVSLAPTLGVFFFGARELRKLKDIRHESSRDH